MNKLNNELKQKLNYYIRTITYQGYYDRNTYDQDTLITLSLVYNPHLLEKFNISHSHHITVISKYLTTIPNVPIILSLKDARRILYEK